MRIRPGFPALSAALLAFLFAVNVYRAATQSITIDEAYTYNHFVSVPYSQFESHVSFNNHPLNTLLAKASVGLLGVSDFTLRVPSLLGGLLYFVALFRLSRLLFGDSPLLPLAVALNGLCPFVLDHLSAARGYGMGLAFWTLGALYLAQWTWREGAGNGWLLVKAGAAFGLASGSHLNEAIAVAATTAAFLAVRGLREGGRFIWRSAIPLLATTVAVALPLVWTPLRARDVVDGEARFRAAVQTLLDILLFYKKSTRLTSWPGAWEDLHRWPWFLFLAFLGLLLASMAAILYRRSPGASERLALAFFGAALFTFLLLWLEPHVMHHAFFSQRRLLFTLPLLFTAAVLLVQWTWRRARVAAILCAVPLVLLAVQFALEFNTAWYWGWEFDAGTKTMAELLKAGRPETGARPLTVGADWHVSETLDYYRRIYRMGWVAPVTRDPVTCYYDFYAVWETDLPALAAFDAAPLLRNSVSGMVLARADPAGRSQRLAALREAGFRGLPRCGSDILVDRETVEIGQPGASRGLLSGFVCNADMDADCWTLERPALLFRVPHAGKRTLRLDLTIHGGPFRSTGPVVLTAWVNGRRIGERRFDAPGRYVFEQEVPAGALRQDGLTLVETTLDRYYTTGDGQKLGYLLHRAGFVD